MLLKAEDRRRLVKQLSDYLERSPEVRPFPATVTRLLTAMQSSNASGCSLEPIIECDPGLSIQVLRVANSPLYCPSAKVTRIAHAVSLIGIRKLKSIAMAAAAAAMFSTGATAESRRRLLWRHSIGCGIVARGLAAHVPKLDTEEAFLAGVFHDVGKLILFDAIPDEYSELTDTYYGTELVREEQFLLGVTHEETGLKCAHAWHLSKEIKTAIGWHHRPEQSPVFSEIVVVVACADALARFWGIGSEVNAAMEDPTEIVQKCGLTQEALEELRANSLADFQETVRTWVS